MTQLTPLYELSRLIRQAESELEEMRKNPEVSKGEITEVEESVRKKAILKFTLQPIIENAIYHGIKERRGASLIRIEAKAVNKQLHIRIEDEGKGMTPQQLTNVRKALAESVYRTENPEQTRNKRGYGLLNVQARIQLTHGSEYGVTIESQEDAGTAINIILPIMDQNNGEK